MSGHYFPAHFGRNLDALNSCVSDVGSGDYGWDADVHTGVVVVLRAFDVFTAVDRRTAQHVLDIFARQARCAILIGHRIIALCSRTTPGWPSSPWEQCP